MPPRDNTYLGRYELGQRLPLAVTVRDSAGAIAWPDDLPVASLYQGGSRVAWTALPAREVGRFGMELSLGSQVAPGRLFVVYLWSVGGIPRAASAQAEVLPGGDPAGALVALGGFRRPEAVHVLAQTDQGLLLDGTNPRT